MVAAGPSWPAPTFIFSHVMGTEGQYNGPLAVTVRTVTGQSAVVQTWGYRSVMQLKITLSRLWGLLAQDIHLIFQEQAMIDDLTLGSYMSEDSTVILVPRLNSGFY